jgi:WD40 repeat protein
VTVAWHPQGTTAVGGDASGTIRWWDVASGRCLYVRQGDLRVVLALRISPDGSTVASCGADGMIRLWAMHDAQHIRTLHSKRPYEGLNITGTIGLTEAQKATLLTLGAVENTR